MIFNPQAVPVVGTDRHLPAVSRERLLPAALRKRFQHPPHWTPEHRPEPRFMDRAPRQASVLLVVLPHADGPTLLLTQRSAHLPTHAGQIAFPGGKVDDADADAAAAALREAQEEVGLAPDRVEVLGQLPTYTTGTAFIITPVVALVSQPVQWQANPAEVDEVFEVPLSFLMNPAHHRRHHHHWEGRTHEWYSMPYADAQGERFIWGATAGMLRNLYYFLSA
jgi:8-oxo-dGTP pyrophosphatase MutT (NUDIX family)